jgi:hypothetical protein
VNIFRKTCLQALKDLDFLNLLKDWAAREDLKPLIKKDIDENPYDKSKEYPEEFLKILNSPT